MQEIQEELILAARTNDKEAVETSLASLMAMTKSPGSQPLLTSMENSAAHYAAANNNVEILALLLHHVPVLASLKNESGSTALHWAALNGHIECVEILLNAGADARCRNGSGRSPATLAEQQGHMQVANILLKSYTDEDGDSEDDVDASHKESIDR